MRASGLCGSRAWLGLCAASRRFARPLFGYFSTPLRLSIPSRNFGVTAPFLPGRSPFHSGASIFPGVTPPFLSMTAPFPGMTPPIVPGTAPFPGMTPPFRPVKPPFSRWTAPFGAWRPPFPSWTAPFLCRTCFSGGKTLFLPCRTHERVPMMPSAARFKSQNKSIINLSLL